MARPVRSNAWFGRGRGWPHSALTGSTSTHPMPAARPVGDGCDLGYDAARRSLGTLRVRPRFPSRHRVIGYVVSATWLPLRHLSSPNVQDQLPGRLEDRLPNGAENAGPVNCIRSLAGTL